MSKKIETLKYSGAAIDVFVYGDGELVVQATTNKNGSRSFVYVAHGKSPPLATLVKIDLTLVTGTGTVTIADQPKKKLKKGSKISIPAGARYSFDGTSAILTATTKPGPGFGGFPKGGIGGSSGTGPH